MREETLNTLEQLSSRFEELQMEMSNPEIISNTDKYLELVKEANEIKDTVKAYNKYKDLQQVLADDKDLLAETPNSEADMKDLILLEIDETEEKINELEEEILESMRPKDPRDEKNVIMEIRAGAGGDESALFSADLYSMYKSYAESKGFKVEVAEKSENDLGGFKEITLIISGKGAFSRLKYESGVHRVQRVPETESQGRVHTSTCTVAVMAEVDDVDVEINDSDLRIDTYRSSGAGGQHVNKTSSAIRITHLPTGIVVTCQDERSQHKNKAKAMKILRARLYDKAVREREEKIAGERKSQIGTGERSERIRTYNYPQGRVTDHRINLTLYKLEDVLKGDLDLLIDPLQAADRAEALLEVTTSAN